MGIDIYYIFTEVTRFLTGIIIITNIVIFYKLLRINKIELSYDNIDNFKASIIIPVRNNPNGIKDLISTLGPSNHELIIVDDESTDATPDIARKLCEKYGYKYIRVKKPSDWMGKAYACWRGFLESNNEYIIFIDSDTRVKPEIINTLCELLMKYDVVSLVPRMRCKTFTSTIFEYSFTILTWLFYPPWRFKDDEKRWLAGAIMAWRRDSYEKIGGHKSVKDSPVEDVSLAKRASENGLRIGFFSLSGHYTDIDYSNRGLIEFMKRVSLVVTVNPINYLYILILGIIANILLAVNLLFIKDILTITYILSLYLPGAYLIYKKYVLCNVFSILLYPISYIYTPIVGYLARREVSRGEAKIIWRGREITIKTS